MSDDDAFTLNTRALDALAKALEKNGAVARVGILGDKTQRLSTKGQAGSLTNATIGAIHEFGTGTLPVRSFLRMPLTTLFNKALLSSGAFDKQTLQDVIKSKSFRPWLVKAAVVAEGLVLGAFDSGGYGIWPPSNMARKTNHQTLVETQQLRNSITSEVTQEDNE